MASVSISCPSCSATDGVVLWRDGAVRPLVEAGTHRNDSGDSLNVAGIHVLQGVEDVNLSYDTHLTSL
ncbi:hypothetical protein FHA54_21060 [Escherichia coli]|nr:hypothetical protein [Escherichia coli]